MDPPGEEFLAEHTADVALRDGTSVRIRPITADDRAQLERGFERLSPKSRYLRFLAPLNELTSDMLDYLTQVDYHDHFAWVAIALDDPDLPGIGVARYVRLAEEPTVAEPAVAVVDDYQGRGLGTILLYTLAETAMAHGVDRFRALVLAENESIIQVFLGMGASLRRAGGALMQIEIDLPPEPDGLPDSSLRQALRTVARGQAEVRIPLTRWMGRET